MGKAWGGRFAGGTDKSVEAFTESISFDWRLYRHDIAGSIAHATMLQEVGLISAADLAAIRDTLKDIEAEIAAGTFPFDIAKEDIHLHIEAELTNRVGDAGKRLHTARSRNDQVATDLRLWLRTELDALDALLADLQRSFLAAAENAAGLIVPAYTHLQRAQPVLAAHAMLAHVEKYQRDRERLADCRKRTNVLPLGAAAVAGTSLPIDRRRVAELLGFDGVARNSVDATSDRDFALEAAAALAIVATHLSGWAEEWILWSTTEFGFLRLPDAFCTGSSIMPQKKNPDVLELVRGKTARVHGALHTLLTLVKGLPLAYNRDLQEDKQPLFDGMDTVQACVRLAALMVRGAEFDRRRIAESLERGHLDATTLMEQLIKRGVPMRSAHHAVGELVGRCEAEGKTLAQLPASAFDAACPGHGEALRRTLGAAQAVEAFVSEGSTAPKLVAEQVAAWKALLAN